MTIQKVGTRADGSLLGEDESGQLYAGTISRVGWDKLEREVTDNGDGRWLVTYKVGDYVTAKATMVKVSDEDMKAYMDAREAGQNPPAPQGFNPNYHQHVAEKKFISVPMQDGTTQEFERLFDVPAWEAI